VDNIKGIKGNPIVQAEAARQAGILKKKKTGETKKKDGNPWSREALGAQVGDKLDILRQTHIKILRSEGVEGVSNKMGGVSKKGSREVIKISNPEIPLLKKENLDGILGKKSVNNIAEKIPAKEDILSKEVADDPFEKKNVKGKRDVYDDFDIDGDTQISRFRDIDGDTQISRFRDIDGDTKAGEFRDIDDDTMVSKPRNLDDTFGIGIPDATDVINIVKEFISANTGSYVTRQGYHLYVYRDPKSEKGYFTISIPLGDGTVEQVSVFVSADNPNKAQIFKRKVITPDVPRK